MREYIRESLCKVQRLYDDINKAECIGEPVKEIILRYLKGREDSLRDCLTHVDEPKSLEEQAKTLSATLIGLMEVSRNIGDVSTVELLNLWYRTNEDFLAKITEGSDGKST